MEQLTYICIHISNIIILFHISTLGNSFNLNNISLSWRLEEIKTKLLDGLRRTLNVLLNLTDAYFLLDKII